MAKVVKTELKWSRAGGGAINAWPKTSQGSLKGLYKRMVLVSQNAAAMSFAWCLLFAAKWEIT